MKTEIAFINIGETANLIATDIELLAPELISLEVNQFTIRISGQIMEFLDFMRRATNAKVCKNMPKSDVKKDLEQV